MARKGRVDRGMVERRLSDGTKVWYARLFHNGKEHWFGGFSTKTKARVFYEDRKREQREGRLQPERYHHGGCETLEELVESYLPSTGHKKAKKWEEFFAAWWKERLQGKRLNQVTPALLDEARQALLSKGLTPQRVNRYVDWLRHVLNIAVRDEKLLSNPVTKLKRFKEPRGRTPFLTTDDEGKLLKALGPVYGPWARLAILTGMRQAEQFGLR